MKKEEAAAVCIQRHFRGYLGRKEYLKVLYEQFEKVRSTIFSAKFQRNFAVL